ncbi:MAG: FkbM family methyltransferase [Candidatus Micrarchaeota archaeon]|nr:FkbM family methyltransferase [Candidatus Micrarchaeota archaeon]
MKIEIYKRVVLEMLERLKIILGFFFLMIKYVKAESWIDVIIFKVFGIPRKIKFKDGTEETNIYYNSLLLYPYKREIVNEKNKIYCWEINNKKYYATFSQASTLYDYITNNIAKVYSADFKNKRVLDVGGHIGDSAVYFLDNGASFVDIYEPVEQNIISMKLNLANYPKEKFKINQLAVGDKEGEIKIFSSHEPGGAGFGLVITNIFNKTIKSNIKEYVFSCVSFTKILKENNYDIAKIDCEGCEEFLVAVDDNLIKKIPLWIIEIHSKEIERKLLEKFGTFFNAKKVHKVNSEVSIYRFELKKQT